MTSLVGGPGHKNHTSLGSKIDHIRGRAVTTLTRPKHARFLHLICENGFFRVRVGVHATMPPRNVSATTTGGEGSRLLDARARFADRGLIMEAPDAITVRGYGNAHVLTYYWV